MINMQVIKIKDIIKYLVEVTLVITIIMSLTRYFSNLDINKQSNIIKTEVENTSKKLSEQTFINCLSTTVPVIALDQSEKDTDEDISKNIDNRTGTQRLLDIELGMANSVIDTSEFDEQAIIADNSENDTIEEVKTDVSTEVIDNSQINTKFTNEYGSVKIKNESKYDLTEDILTPNIELSDKKDILLFHTHTCESYTPSEKYSYEQTGNYRTTDLNFSVARVGTELENCLKTYGYNVIHDQTYHDYPAYTGSYDRSLKTVKNLLATKPETEVVFDVHRDAVGSSSSYAPTVKIGDEYAAQLMLVIGTDGGGLEHPNWQQNLKFAVKLQEKANEMYPGLFKPIIIRNSRYNQHVTKAAGIIEVGATGNTLDQCLVSMKYLAKVISEVVK